jgi:putative glutamine amidotransferase
LTAPKVLVAGRGAQKLAPYLAALRSAGIDPLAVEPGDPVPAAQGLVLTGGSDVDPKQYGQAPDPSLDNIDPGRDDFERNLLARAEQADIPILAICRGLQLLNVHRGGTLIQHLAQSGRHRRRDVPPSQPVHPVKVKSDSRLAAILGTTEIQVNSRHHQAVDRLGSGLLVTAQDPDDRIIEAIEDPTRRFLLAVQWHPEDQESTDPVQHRLFEAFAASLAASGTR